MKPKLQNEFFSAYQVMPGVTMITGMARECCYLIEGKERALLVDGLTGIGSLKDFLTKLTSLPVSVAITHGHMDHTGIAWESDAVYIHAEDVGLMFSDEHTNMQKRLDFIRLFLRFGIPFRTEPTMDDVLPPRAVRTIPIVDGDIFDLGDCTIKAINVPGHTRGTVVFLDKARRCIFAGDACNSNTLLNLKGSASVAEYKEGLEHLWEHEADFDVLWNGHDYTAVPKIIVQDGIALCEQIMTRTDDAIETEDAFGGKSLLAARREKGYVTHNDGLCNIVYKAEYIFDSPEELT